MTSRADYTSQGGFGNCHRCLSHFLFRIAEDLASIDAASMMCGGITVYSPLKIFGCGWFRSAGGYSGCWRIGLLWPRSQRSLVRRRWSESVGRLRNAAMCCGWALIGSATDDELLVRTEGVLASLFLGWRSRRPPSCPQRRRLRHQECRVDWLNDRIARGDGGDVATGCR
jgi:hypothetical protein